MCIAYTKTVTAAQMARRALALAGIESDIVGIDPRLTKNGCAYGVRFSCVEAGRVRRILKEKGIAYGEILGG